MEQRLQLNRVTVSPNKGEKAIILELTDVLLHSNARRPTQSVGSAVRRSIENNSPGRVFTPFKAEKTDQNLTLKFKMPFVMNDPVLKQTIHDYQQQGYRVLLQIPKAGLPIKLGKDAQEFVKSKNGKRILRKLARNEDGSKM